MRKKQWFALAGAGLCLLTLFSAALPGFAAENGTERPPQFVYLREGTVYRYDPGGAGKQVVMAPGEEGKEELSRRYSPIGGNMHINEYLMYSTTFSEDHRFMCHLEDFDRPTYTSTLYCEDFSAQENAGTPFVIDTQVYGYTFIPGHRLLYTKTYSGHDRDQTFFLYDLDRQERQAVPLALNEDSQGGDLYGLNTEGTLALWREYGFTKYSGSLYLIDLQNPAAGKSLLTSDLAWFPYISKDLQTIYYDREDGVYCLKGLSAEVKVVADQSLATLQVIEGTENAYWTAGSQNTTVGDFIDDDMAEEDAAVAYPQESDYQTEVQESDGTVTTVLDEARYRAAMERYYQKLRRDNLRGYIDASYTSNRGSLYYFNGRKTIKVAENVQDVKQLGAGADLLGVEQDTTTISIPRHSIKLSEINSYEELRDRINAGSKISSRSMFLVEDRLLPVPLAAGSGTTLEDMAADAENHTFYYIEFPHAPTDAYYTGGGSLKAAPYTKEAIGAPREVDTGADYIIEGSGNAVYYTKDADYDPDSETGTIYTEGVKVSDGILDGEWVEGVLYYLKKEGNSYALYRFDGQNSQRITSQAHRFLPLGRDAVAALKDGQTVSDLILWTADGTETLIDYNVSEAPGFFTTRDAADYEWEPVGPG